ncbi:MAG: hypothetical protein ACXVCR_01315 [Bdellovibrio sp.]
MLLKKTAFLLLFFLVTIVKLVFPKIYAIIRFQTELGEVFDISIDKYAFRSDRKNFARFKQRLLQVFRSFDYKNIRTLNQCLRWLSDLFDKKIKLRPIYASYHAALLIIKSTTGRLLNDPTIYSFVSVFPSNAGSGKKSISKNQLRKELTEAEQEFLYFYERFFMNGNIIHRQESFFQRHL